MLSQQQELALLAVAGQATAPNATVVRQLIERATGVSASWAGTALGDLVRGGYVTRSGIVSVYAVTPRGEAAINQLAAVRTKLLMGR